MVLAYIFMGMLFPGNALMKLAVMVYFIAPPSFAVPSYIKSEEGTAFVSTINSLYVIVTIIGYVIITSIA